MTSKTDSLKRKLGKYQSACGKIGFFKHDKIPKCGRCGQDDYVLIGHSKAWYEEDLPTLRGSCNE